MPAAALPTGYAPMVGGCRCHLQLPLLLLLQLLLPAPLVCGQPYGQPPPAPCVVRLGNFTASSSTTPIFPTAYTHYPYSATSTGSINSLYVEVASSTPGTVVTVELQEVVPSGPAPQVSTTVTLPGGAFYGGFRVQPLTVHAGTSYILSILCQSVSGLRHSASHSHGPPMLHSEWPHPHPQATQVAALTHPPLLLCAARLSADPGQRDSRYRPDTPWPTLWRRSHAPCRRLQ